MGKYQLEFVGKIQVQTQVKSVLHASLELGTSLEQVLSAIRACFERQTILFRFLFFKKGCPNSYTSVTRRKLRFTSVETSQTRFASLNWRSNDNAHQELQLANSLAVTYILESHVAIHHEVLHSIVRRNRLTHKRRHTLKSIKSTRRNPKEYPISESKLTCI